MDESEEKSIKISNIISKRDVERRLDIEKKREDKKQTLAANENIDFFDKTFNDKRDEIEKLLNSCTGIETSKLTAHFDDVSKKILNLQKYVAASNIFLRSYDIKRCQESLQFLTARAKLLEEQLFPKKRFGFKNRKASAKKDQKKLPVDVVDFCDKKPSVVSDDDCEFENEIGQVLMLEGERVFKRDVRVRNLERCVIKLYGNPTTLHMSRLDNCVVLSGPVSTSIFAENCTNCKLIIACQQLRLHSSSQVDVYLHVTSRAIMEDCSKVSLAPYNLDYPGIKEDFVTSGLDFSVNHWTSVDDFNWLNTEIASPNWSILSESKRIKDWNSFSLAVG